MAPTPTPIHPLLTNAKDTWDRVETILDWFSKIVTTAYSYSDMVIEHRQEGVNKKYKIEKAEKEALRIMKEQENKKKAVTKNLGKRAWSESAWEDEDVYDLDWFLEFLDETGVGLKHV